MMVVQKFLCRWETTGRFRYEKISFYIISIMNNGRPSLRCSRRGLPSVVPPEEHHVYLSLCVRAPLCIIYYLWCALFFLSTFSLEDDDDGFLPLLFSWFVWSR